MMSAYLLSTNEVFSTRIKLYLVEFCPNGCHGNHQISQTVAKAVDSSPQTNNKTLLMKIRPTQLIEHGELSWCLHKAFTLCCSVFGTKGYPHATKRELLNINPATNLLVCYGILPVRDASTMGAQRLRE